MIKTKKILPILVFILTMVAVSATILAAAPAKAPVKPAVKGTQQLDGSQAQFGLTYTLGGTTPINVKLISAEYTVTPVIMGTNYVVPTFEQKLLVIHYMLQNPNKADFGIGWGTLNFTAIDPSELSYDYCQSVSMETDSSNVNMTLKPGQKLNVFTLIKVPAKADISKLLVEGSARKVLRYDLHRQGNPPGTIVKPMAAPYADPADPTGFSAAAIVPSQIGVFYHYGALDIRVDSASFSTEPINGKAPKVGYRYLTVIWTAQNISMQPQNIGWGTVVPSLTDADGIAIDWNSQLLAASRDINVNQSIDPKSELRVRSFFLVPNGVALKKLSLRMGSFGRYYVYDLSGIK